MPANATAPKRKGPVPGQRHSGQFKRGFDERRLMQASSDKTIWKDELALKLKKHTGVCARFLADTVKDINLPHNIRLEAVTQILDRTYGKACDRVAMTTLNVGGAAEQTPLAELSSLSTQQLERIAAGALQQIEAPIEGEIIENDNVDDNVKSET